MAEETIPTDRQSLVELRDDIIEDLEYWIDQCSQYDKETADYSLRLSLSQWSEALVQALNRVKP